MRNRKRSPGGVGWAAKRVGAGASRAGLRTGAPPPARLLVAALFLFALSNLAAALSSSVALLVVARVVAALASALYTPNASVAGAGLAPLGARGRALAIVFGA